MGCGASAAVSVGDTTLPAAPAQLLTEYAHVRTAIAELEACDLLGQLRALAAGAAPQMPRGVLGVEAALARLQALRVREEALLGGLCEAAPASTREQELRLACAQAAESLSVMGGTRARWQLARTGLEALAPPLDALCDHVLRGAGADADLLDWLRQCGSALGVVVTSIDAPGVALARADWEWLRAVYAEARTAASVQLKDHYRALQDLSKRTHAAVHFVAASLDTTLARKEAEVRLLHAARNKALVLERRRIAADALAFAPLCWVCS